MCLVMTSRFVPMPARDRVAESPSDTLKKYDDELKRVPDSGLLHHGRGIILMALGRLDEARRAFDSALDFAPRHADIWVSIGELHLAQHDRAAASAAFQNALTIDDLTPGAWEGLRRATNPFKRWRVARRMAARRRADEARLCETDPRASQVITEAARLGKMHHHAEAIDLLRKFLEQCPGHVTVTATLSALLAGLGNVAQGRAHLRRLAQWWPESALAAYYLGAYLITSGDRGAGIDSLRRALALDPQDRANARFVLATAGVEDTPQVAADEVRGIFDSYAGNFDKDLVENLEYRVPEWLAAAIGKSGRRWAHALDIGCGTGLCGVQLRARVERLVGVDLSEKMLEKARARNVYDALACVEAVEYLARASEPFDLMVAADVLIYIGDVSALFPAVAARLAPGGEFWFSVESTSEGFHITMSRRYQHSLSYLEAMARASGLRIKYHQEIDIRRHATEMQKGLLVAIGR